MRSTIGDIDGYVDKKKKGGAALSLLHYSSTYVSLNAEINIWKIFKRMQEILLRHCIQKHGKNKEVACLNGLENSFIVF